MPLIPSLNNSILMLTIVMVCPFHTANQTCFTNDLISATMLISYCSSLYELDVLRSEGHLKNPIKINCAN